MKEKEFEDLPSRVEYSLTDAGKSLMPVLYEIVNWGNSNQAKKIVTEMVK
ncbi:winged helix-turn-helix transcriptional regulator [Flavobacterium gawalongense]|nr:winged helix-turn-helix transcriptional regulator [Flavobacterium gawalongense]